MALGEVEGCANLMACRFSYSKFQVYPISYILSHIYFLPAQGDGALV